MRRKLVSPDQMLGLLNTALAADQDCRRCRFVGQIWRMPEVATVDCNWSAATLHLRCSGHATEPCQDAAQRVLADIRLEYNLT